MLIIINSHVCSLDNHDPSPEAQVQKGRQKWEICLLLSRPPPNPVAPPNLLCVQGGRWFFTAPEFTNLSGLSSD